MGFNLINCESQKPGLKKARKHLNSQNVNRIVDIPTFAKVFWCKLVQINFNSIKHLTDLKHRHLADAFFLALMPDNNSVWFEY